MRGITIMTAVAFLGCTSSVIADGYAQKGSARSITLPEPTIALKDGAGMDTARGYCSICHSLDYITTQPKFSHAKWQAEVAKMVKVYGAPIDDAKAKTIADYIATTYGKGDAP